MALQQYMQQVQLQSMQDAAAYSRAALAADGGGDRTQNYWAGRFGTAQSWGKAGVTGDKFAEAFRRIYGEYPQEDEYYANQNGLQQMQFEMGQLGSALQNYVPSSGASSLNPALQGFLEG